MKKRATCGNSSAIGITPVASYVATSAWDGAYLQTARELVLAARPSATARRPAGRRWIPRPLRSLPPTLLPAPLLPLSQSHAPLHEGLVREVFVERAQIDSHPARHRLQHGADTVQGGTTVDDASAEARESARRLT